MKETLTFTTPTLMEKFSGLEDVLLPLYKTPTDVLRLTVAMSEGDVSLKEKTCFKSFKAKDRMLLLALLNKSSNIEENMLRDKTEWIKLGEKLHPGDYKNRYRRAFNAFNKIRNNEPIFTYRSNIEKLFNVKDLDRLTIWLSKRPVEFARLLDRAIRTSKDGNCHRQLELRGKVVKAFGEVAESVATPILLGLRAYFQKRSDLTNEYRVFFPKGSMAKTYAVENNLSDIEEILRIELRNTYSIMFIILYKCILSQYIPVINLLALQKI